MERTRRTLGGRAKRRALERLEQAGYKTIGTHTKRADQVVLYNLALNEISDSTGQTLETIHARLRQRADRHGLII